MERNVSDMKKKEQSITDLLLSSDKGEICDLLNRYNEFKPDYDKRFMQTMNMEKTLGSDEGLLASICKKNGVKPDIIRELIILESEMLGKVKRRGINQKIYNLIEEAIRSYFCYGGEEN